jgi:hypothetical protein
MKIERCSVPKRNSMLQAGSIAAWLVLLPLKLPENFSGLKKA